MVTAEDKKREIKIRVLMWEKDLYGSEIARKAKVTRPAITMTIQGRIKGRTLRTAIAEALGVPFEELWS